MGTSAEIKIELIEKIASQCIHCSNASKCLYAPNWCFETGYSKRFDKSLYLKKARTNPGSAS